MSGFLNKKDRVIDFSLTDRGLELMSKNNLDFSYATVSDRSIVYKEDYDSQELRKISDSEFFYNSFEVSTSKENNDFFRFEEATKDYYLIEYKSRTKLDDLISRKNLSTSDIRFEENLEFRDASNPSVFNITNFRRYPTVRSESYLSEIKNIIDDSRFKNKTNIKFLPPTNTDYDFDINTSYNDTGFLNIIKGFSYESEGDDLDIQLMSYIEENKEIFRFYFELDKKSANDYFMINFNEINSDNKFRELKIIKYKTLLDTTSNKLKTIFLIGKFITNKDKKKYAVLEHEESKLTRTNRHRKEFILEQTANKLDFSEEYESKTNFNSIESLINSRFVSIFTVVVE